MDLVTIFDADLLILKTHLVGEFSTELYLGKKCYFLMRSDTEKLFMFEVESESV